ncbi:pyridoxal phosphate-dependent aminotransferase [Haloimpatiens lingqiaonensis]|uniref:pyridoxal phosphate-dependent aminotransferase n=1 Tax=Haloimpatiens lingqiaonensis TaxID=1380675 RepID=UPI0010FEB4D4|nr:histidinol-phosphate transaminase [Haloimpatiens lingqiaonensis]
MIHGGDIYTNGVLKGVELIDFSSNINPLGIPESFTNNINEALNNCTRYPDIKYREILKNLSDYTGVYEENFVLGNGAAEIIDLCIACFKSILITVPSFAEYEIDGEKHGCKIEYSYLNKDHMGYDYDDILEKISNAEALVIGNPNNPNGGIINKDKFKSILDFCERENKTIIIDEAFIEFVGDNEKSFVKELENYRCIFIIRALTKFFGMPGIRFGYGMSRNKDLLKNIREKQNPWNINCFAETAVKYVLKDKKYIEDSLLWINTQRKFIISGLNNIQFIDKVFGTNANFILVKLKNVDCNKLYDYCLENGILIRKCNNYKGLNEYYVRFAIKDEEKNKVLINTLAKFSQL